MGKQWCKSRESDPGCLVRRGKHFHGPCLAAHVGKEASFGHTTCPLLIGVKYVPFWPEWQTRGIRLAHSICMLKPISCPSGRAGSSPAAGTLRTVQTIDMALGRFVCPIQIN
jgi:hypothetical protein